MSFAIQYTKAAGQLKKRTGGFISIQPEVICALYTLRKTQIRLDNLILRHAVTTMLNNSTAPLSLSQIGLQLKEVCHLKVSKSLIKKVVIRPLRKKEYLIPSIERGADGGLERLYTGTPQILQCRLALETEIITESRRLSSFKIPQ